MGRSTSVESKRTVHTQAEATGELHVWKSGAEAGTDVRVFAGRL